MSAFTEKITIGKHQINGPFIHQEEQAIAGFNFASMRIRLDQSKALEHNYNFIEYILVVLDVDLTNTNLKVQVNGQDMQQDSPAIYYQKVLPLECDGLYDGETNKLLESMVKNDVKNVFFLPFRTTKNGYSLDMTPESTDNVLWTHNDNLTLCFRGLPSESHNKIITIYQKFSKENSKNIEKINYSTI